MASEKEYLRENALELIANGGACKGRGNSFIKGRGIYVISLRVRMELKYYMGVQEEGMGLEEEFVWHLYFKKTGPHTYAAHNEKVRF